MKRRKILISNDDGIGSPFLNRFLEAFSKSGAELTALVPASEQSWIGRAYSRHKTLTLKDCGYVEGVKCYTIDGTPSDCVNIALGHLYKDGLPDAVVSGLNIGQNLGMPLLWSSGTFSAAAEGAGWGVASFAFSQQLANEFYEICRLRHAKPPEKLDKILEQSCAKSAEIVKKFLDEKAVKSGYVCNVNFPLDYTSDTEFKKCVPALVGMTDLYKTQNSENFEFKYGIGAAKNKDVLTDMQCMQNSWACYSLINTNAF